MTTRAVFVFPEGVTRTQAETMVEKSSMRYLKGEVWVAHQEKANRGLMRRWSTEWDATAGKYEYEGDE